MSLSQIIDVVISRQTTAVESAGFGVPLFVVEGDYDAPKIPLEESVRMYVSSAGVAIDFPAVGGKDSAPVLAAQAFFNQSPSIQEFYVAEHLSTGTTTKETVGEALARIVASNDEWYVATYSSRVVVAQIAFAQAVAGLSSPKLVCVGSAKAANYSPFTDGTHSGDDLGGQLKDLNADRILSFYSSAAKDHTDYKVGDANPYPECAFVGYNLPFLAGQATWAFLKLNGVPTSTITSGARKLSPTEISYLQAKNMNYMETIAGNTLSREGKVSSGEWIDIIRGIDAMDESITKALLTLLISQQGSKVPFTNAGMNQIKNVISNQLQVYVNRGFIVNNFVVNVPDADYAGHDKPNRTVKDVSFEAQLQGAVHAIKVRGTVTYNVPTAV